MIGSTSEATTNTTDPTVEHHEAYDASELHLVIVWEPTNSRLGESAAVGQPVILGRGPAREDDPAPRLRFKRQRPGETVSCPLIRPERLSRTQLLIRPLAEDKLEVRNLGRSTLLVNGRNVDQTEVGEGDVLTLVGALVLLVESRPKVMAALPPAPAYAAFAFGEADEFGVVGESQRCWDQRRTLAAYAPNQQPLLVVGESGAGKELAVQTLHRLSPRRQRSLIARNAATLPPALLDAELFGTARNYPNVGSPDRPGLIGQADGSTLFLDEVGELPTELQAHLLRFLDHGEYHRLGEACSRRVSVCFVGATNAALETLKHDFLARFSRRLRISGLNDRRADIPLLVVSVARLAAQHTRSYERFIASNAQGNRVRVDASLIHDLISHRYTHHYRELQRLVNLALESSPGRVLTCTPAVRAELALGSRNVSAENLSKQEIVAALDASGGSVAKAAQALSLSSRYALYRLMKRHGIDKSSGGIAEA